MLQISVCDLLPFVVKYMTVLYEKISVEVNRCEGWHQSQWKPTLIQLFFSSSFPPSPPPPPVSSLNSFVNYWMAFTVVHGVLRKLPEWCLHHSGPFSQSCNVITLGHLATWTEQCISPTLGCLASVDNLCIRLAQSHRERPGPFVTTYVLPCLALSHCCLSLIIK